MDQVVAIPPLDSLAGLVARPEDMAQVAVRLPHQSHPKRWMARLVGLSNVAKTVMRCSTCMPMDS